MNIRIRWKMIAFMISVPKSEDTTFKEKDIFLNSMISQNYTSSQKAKMPPRNLHKIGILFRCFFEGQ